MWAIKQEKKVGYPISRTARSAASAAAGLSNASRAASSAAAFYNARTPVSALPTGPKGSAALRALGLIRFSPWLYLAVGGYELYKFWNSNNFQGISPVMRCGVPVGSGYLNTPTGCGGTHWSVTGDMGKVNITISPTEIAYQGHYCVPSGLPGIQDRRIMGILEPTYRFLRSSGPAPKVHNYNAPFEDVWPLPEIAPQVNPWYKPILKPSPDLPPMPFPEIPHRTDPWPNPDPSPRPSPRPSPNPVPRPNPSPFDPPMPGPIGDPVPTPRPHPEPVTPSPPKKPDPETEPGRVKRPPPRPRIPRDEARDNPRVKLPQRVPMIMAPMARGFPKPPGRRVAEVKLRRGAMVGLMWAAINAITETRDFIKSLHKALPKRLHPTRTTRHGIGRATQANGPTVQRMFSEVFNGIRNMTDAELADFTNKAIDNLITDQIKDYVFGKVGQQIAKASRADRRPIGYQGGPSL